MPEFYLKIEGDVEKFVEITPRRVLLSGPIGKELKVSVSIKPMKNYPFKITKSKAKSGKFITYTLKENKEPGKSGYTLVVENVKKDPGYYYDNLIFVTDSKVKPEISIGVRGNIRGPQKNQANVDPMGKNSPPSN